MPFNAIIKSDLYTITVHVCYSHIHISYHFIVCNVGSNLKLEALCHEDEGGPHLFINLCIEEEQGLTKDIKTEYFPLSVVSSSNISGCTLFLF